MIPANIMADAALSSGSYARALLYCENHIRQSRDSMSSAELQTYYSKLQMIYSQLDEPDGVLGISTKIISPTLEQQLLELESLGKWDMAQSCYDLISHLNPSESVQLGALNCMTQLGQFSMFSRILMIT